MGPGYEFLPAPLWLITILHILTLTLHFVAMNFLLGGVIVVLFGKFDNRWSNEVVQKFIKFFPSAMAATVTLGVAPLLFLQLTYHKQVYSAAIISGWWWLGIVVMAIVAYYFLYAAAFGKSQSRTGLYLVLSLVSLIYISYVYSAIFSLAERPGLMAELYASNQSGWILNPSIGDYILRWLHMILGAVTVGGFFVGWIGGKNEQAYQIGKMVFLWGMVAAMVVGLAYMLNLTEILLPFMRTPAVWYLLVSIVLSAGSLHFFFKRKFVPAAAMLFVSMLGMVAIRHHVRILFLEGVWDPAGMAMRPQWSVFALFLLCFVAAIAALWYMLRLYFADRAENGGEGVNSVSCGIRQPSDNSVGARGHMPTTYTTVSRKRWRRVLAVMSLVALTSIALAACGEEEIVDPHFRYDHRSDWESHTPTEYVIDQIRICYCVYQLDTVRLTVVNDSIISAIERSTGQALTSVQLEGYLTVDQLFDWTEELEGMTVATSTIVYRSDYGYPSYVYVDYDAGIADDEISFATELIEINAVASR